MGCLRISNLVPLASSVFCLASQRLWTEHAAIRRKPRAARSAESQRTKQPRKSEARETEGGVPLFLCHDIHGVHGSSDSS